MDEHKRTWEETEEHRQARTNTDEPYLRGETNVDKHGRSPRQFWTYLKIGEFLDEATEGLSEFRKRGAYERDEYKIDIFSIDTRFFIRNLFRVEGLKVS